MIGLPSRNAVTPNRNGSICVWWSRPRGVDRFRGAAVSHVCGERPDVTSSPRSSPSWWPGRAARQSGEELAPCTTGQDSTANQELIQDSRCISSGRCHVTASELWRSDAPLPHVDALRFRVAGVRDRVVVFGTDRRVVVTTPRACTTNSAKASPRQSARAPPTRRDRGTTQARQRPQNRAKSKPRSPRSEAVG